MEDVDHIFKTKADIDDLPDIIAEYWKNVVIDSFSDYYPDGNKPSKRHLLREAICYKNDEMRKRWIEGEGWTKENAKGMIHLLQVENEEEITVVIDGNKRILKAIEKFLSR